MSDVDFEYDIKPRDRNPVRFRLSGEDYVYTFVPPKQTVILLPVLESSDGDGNVLMTQSTYRWFMQGLREEDAAHVKARLDDEDDDLDIDGMTEVISKLSEAKGGRPTT